MKVWNQDLSSFHFAPAWPALAGACLLLGGLLACPASAQPTTGVELPTLDLQDCIHIALKESPALHIAGQQQEIASQNVKEAWWAFSPTIQLGYDWQNSERTDFSVTQYKDDVVELVDSGGDILLFPVSTPDGTFADEEITTDYNAFSGGARLDILDHGFRNFKNLSAAKHRLEAARADGAYSRALVVEYVITTYFNLLRREKLLDVALDTRDQAAKELERTETYFRLGSAAKSDVLQQKVRLSNTKLDLVVAENAVKQAFVNLAYAMSRPLASEFAIDSSVLNTDFPIAEVERLYQEALASRKDLFSSQENLEANRMDVASATTGFYPTLNAFVNYTRYENNSPYRFGSQESESFTSGWGVSWDIFDKMRTWTGRAKAKANVRIAEYQLEQAHNDIRVEIRQLHNLMVEAREKAQTSREAIEESLENLRLAQERFRVGAGTTLDVIVAQVSLASSRAEEVQAMCDFLIAEARMQRAVGRLTFLGGNSG